VIIIISSIQMSFK